MFIIKRSAFHRIGSGGDAQAAAASLQSRANRSHRILLCGSIRLAVVVVVTSALAGCQPSANESAVSDGGTAAGLPSISSLENLEFTQNGVVHHDASGRVQVELSSAWSPEGLLVIRGVFTPDDAGFHLYGSQLPKAGVTGIGRPTLIEISDAALFQEVGPLISAEEAYSHHDETLDITLPLYPEGAVTLYLPVRFRTLPSAPEQVSLALTYMACSDVRCNSPVEAAVAEITAPAVSNEQEPTAAAIAP